MQHTHGQYDNGGEAQNTFHGDKSCFKLVDFNVAKLRIPHEKRIALAKQF
jgi:hypothetical protein